MSAIKNDGKEYVIEEKASSNTFFPLITSKYIKNKEIVSAITNDIIDRITVRNNLSRIRSLTLKDKKALVPKFRVNAFLIKEKSDSDCFSTFITLSPLIYVVLSPGKKERTKYINISDNINVIITLIILLSIVKEFITNLII